MSISININLLKELSKTAGDSFYIFDSSKFTENYNNFLNAFKKFYDNTIISYSYKTNYIPALVKLAKQLGAYAEVVSEMEYDLAIKIGVEPQKIIVNGPYKSLDSYKKYLLNGSIVNIDSTYEVDIIKKISKKYHNKTFNIGIRCNFIINSEYISRFGIDINEKRFKNIYKELKSIKNIRIKSIHSHFPDRDIKYYRPRSLTMIKIAKELLDEIPEYIDIGGGFYGNMPESLYKQFNIDKLPNYNDYAKEVAELFNDNFKNHIKKPTLILEPGTAIVADTMYFVAKVLDIKRVQNKYIANLSGSKFNLGFLSKTINLPISVIGEKNSCNYYEEVDFAGYTCIESDYLYKNFSGNLCIGDFIVFSNVGSYSVVFKPPFILPNVPVFEIDEFQKIKLIKRKENFEDIFATYIF